jgi:hypothetical protein
MKGSHAENPNQATEHVRLLEVNFDQLGGLSFDIFNGLPNVGYL